MAEVLNQSPPLQDYDLYGTDPALQEAVAREGAGWAAEELGRLGRRLGSAETIQLGIDANRYPPELRSFDRYGNRIDEVAFHPAWHALMALGCEAGIHAAPWAEPREGAHVARAAAAILLVQIESGVQCPLTMTYGSVAALRHFPEVAGPWLAKILTRRYDRRFGPIAEKEGALIGMAIT